MRYELVPVRDHLVDAHLGFDAYCYLDIPETADEDGAGRVDLTDLLSLLVGFGIDAPPHKEWTPTGSREQRGLLGMVSASPGANGRIVVYPRAKGPARVADGWLVGDDELVNLAAAALCDPAFTELLRSVDKDRADTVDTAAKATHHPDGEVSDKPSDEGGSETPAAEEGSSDGGE